jgi:hypothetical protein
MSPEDPVATGFVTHNGKRIYLIDTGGADLLAMEAAAARAELEIRREPLASVRVVTDVTGIPVTMKTVDLLRKLAEGNGPHVKAACIVGLGFEQKMVFNTVKILARRDFQLFDTVREAMDHLAALP